MDLAKKTTYNLSHSYIGTEHLLVGLLQADGLASKVLMENGVTADKLYELINQLISPTGSVDMMEGGNLTPRAKRIIDNSFKEATNLKSQLIGTEHILIA